MDYNNNQAMESEPQILTGDIILQWRTWIISNRKFY
jgi:hypothetical protein